ncbi:MAG TPA: ABC-F family ATP-binding cassette domain-containing protein [Planctomycetota bacterium]|nr:ABC-F family ATP-binding cassette domain-containing protein [Planctomycetota bacterium]
MPVLLNCQSLTKSFGTRVLFENLTFGMDDTERLGLIGPNGSGKSTLLKILAGLEQLDDGTLNLRKNLRAGYVPQNDIFPDGATPWSVLESAAADLHLDERETTNRINAILGRIGYPQDGREKEMSTLSGGWRKRISIARELIREPDLLLMDEPTNHLDLEGIVWLEKLLAAARFAVLLVSHDRWFLEKTCNRVMELNRAYPDGFFSFGGTYSDFLMKREEFLAGQQQAQRSLESKVRREAEWLKRGPPARTTKSRARIDEAGRLMDDLAELKQRNSQGAKVAIEFTSSERQANKLLSLKNVSKSLGGRPLISDLSLVLSPGMKLGLLGRNGSGKTTFLRLLTGDLQPDAGTIERAEKLRIVYFDQAREQLDGEQTLRRALAPSGGDLVTFREQPIHVSGWAKRFLFRPEQLDMAVRSLSGGEQARILIARLMLQPADLLLLDEPTNDLDIPSLEVLEESLADFPGAVVLVTHDRYMLTRLSSELLSLDGEGNANIYTDFQQWERAMEARRVSEGAVRRGAVSAPSALGSAEEGRVGVSPACVESRGVSEGETSAAAKKPRKLSYKEQREFDGMEAQILEAEKTVAQLQKDAESPDIASDPKKLQAAFQALADAQSKVDALYARWQELEEKQR